MNQGPADPEIDEHLAKKDVPIIVLIAYTRAGDRVIFLDAGMNDCLSRQIRVEDFGMVPGTGCLQE